MPMVASMWVVTILVFAISAITSHFWTYHHLLFVMRKDWHKSYTWLQGTTEVTCGCDLTRESMINTD